MLAVEIIQHAVGQGGLLSGQLDLGGSRFRWIYDCGSNQLDALDRGVDIVARQGDIDCLFLSHLDKDHIAGVDRPMGSAHVEEIVLPYINDQEIALLVAGSVNTGATSGLFLDFLADPVAWFLARGARRVTYVQEGENPPDLPGGATTDGEGPLKPKWSDEDGLSSTGSGAEFIVPPGSYLCLGTAQAILNWIFVPQVHRPDPTEIARLQGVLKARFGPSHQLEVLKAARTKEGRSEIRLCYDSLWKNHNLVTMCLYAGPLDQSGWLSTSYDWLSEGHGHWASPSLGWIATGDADFTVDIRRAGFLKHYDRLRHMVGYMALPHHGSRRSHHLEVLTSFPRLTTAVASAGTNSYGHPSPEVMNDVQFIARKNFHQVSEEPRSAFGFRASFQSGR